MAFASLLVVACGGSQQERARVAEIQREADQRIEMIRAESDKRAAEARRQIEELKADLAAKSEELDQARRGGQGGATGADDGLASERRSAADRGRTVLTRLDEEARDIDARSRSLALAARKEIETALAKASEARRSVEDDLRELDAATRETLKPLSDRLELHLGALDDTLRKARRKLK